VKRILALLLLFSACSPKVQVNDAEARKPGWLKSETAMPGYYVGVGHSLKDGSLNYIQAARKSAMDDLISQIKVNVSSTSVLSVMEVDKKLREEYEQIIKTTANEEVEEFEMVDSYEDGGNYWVYYRLSISKYRQIKEEKKRNATTLATDYFRKGRESEKAGEDLQAIGFYFQAFRAMEKYLGEAIKITIDDREVLLVNEIYASIQLLLDKFQISLNHPVLEVNRRLNPKEIDLVARATHKGGVAFANLPIAASFEKGEGDVFLTYRTNENGTAKILMSKIGSRDLEQTIVVKADIDALSATSASQSPVYALIAKTFNVPAARVILKVQRPVVYLTSEERSFGLTRNNAQIANRLKNVLTTNGFEFTTDKSNADLVFEVSADSEKGSVSGSIYITYLTSVIKVMAREGKIIYATTLDRVKGYGLDYDKSSVDAYNKAVEALEKERMKELMSSVLQ